MLDLTPEAIEDLQYRVEIWTNRGGIERLIAVTVRADLGRAVFKEACVQWPDRHITLRLGAQVLAEWKT